VFKTVTLFAGVLFVGTIVITLHPVRAHADDAATPEAAIAACDTDKDGSVDENEAKAAAGAVFDRLDADHDGTVDERELQGRLTSTQFHEADPDHDKTLTKNEYLVAARKALRAADRDNDNSVDANELQTPAGKVLILLMQ
jgi:Ca2+-binding EF-hand superfamily protein